MRVRFVCVGIVLVTQLVGLEGAFAAGSAATVLEAGGCVRETASAECKPAAVGALVAPQSGYVAGKAGSRVRLADGSELALSADAEIVLQPSTKLDLGKEGLRGQVVQLVRGQADVTVASSKSTPSAVLLRGPAQLSAIAKAGSVTVRPGGDFLVVANVGGEALAASGNDWNEVPVGKVRLISKADPKGAVRDLLHAPEPKPSNRFMVTVGAAAVAPLEVSWSAMPNVANYEVVVRRDGGGEVARRQLGANTTSTTFPELGTGSFTARVRAMDTDEITTAWSAPVGLTSVGLALPDGALVTASGVIQLAPNHKVRLLGFEGMEIAVGATWTSTLPDQLGLLNGRPQTLRLRRKGETTEHGIRFEPRSAIAIVELSPKNVRWPGPDVTIRITLADKSGGPRPVGITMVPRVLLDVTPIEATWSEKDGALEATVAARDTGKPHVLRVEVADQFGVDLGRGFVEVAGDSPSPAKK